MNFFVFLNQPNLLWKLGQIKRNITKDLQNQKRSKILEDILHWPPQIEQGLRKYWDALSESSGELETLENQCSKADRAIEEEGLECGQIWERGRLGNLA